MAWAQILTAAALTPQPGHLRNFENVLPLDTLMPAKDTIASRIRTLRRTKTDLNQAELARAIRIDPATMNQIERGRRSPSTETITRLAAYFGVSRDFLMDGIEHPPKDAAPPSTKNHETRAAGERTEEGAREARPDREPAAPRASVDLSAAVQAQIYATLATVFAELAADLEARSATDADREAAGSRATQRPARVARG